jgi:hypothetical protein
VPAACCSDNGKLVAYQLSSGGSDWSTIKVGRGEGASWFLWPCCMQCCTVCVTACSRLRGEHYQAGQGGGGRLNAWAMLHAVLRSRSCWCSQGVCSQIRTELCLLIACVLQPIMSVRSFRIVCCDLYCARLIMWWWLLLLRAGAVCWC